MSNRHYGAARPKVSGAAVMEPPAMSEGEIAAAKAAAEHRMEIESDPSTALEREASRHKAMLDREENAYIESVSSSGALALEGEIAPAPEPGYFAQMGWDANEAEGRAMEDGDYNMFVAKAFDAAPLDPDPEPAPQIASDIPGFFRDMQGNLWLIDLIAGIEIRSRADVGHPSYSVVVHTSYGERQVGHASTRANAELAVRAIATMVAIRTGFYEEESTNG